MPKENMICRVQIDAGDADANTQYPCERHDTLLRAGLRAGLPLPYECNSGGCGSCKFTLLEGDVETLWEEAPGLSRRDRKKGRQLACQCRPLGDCTIKIALETERPPDLPRPRYFKARFLGRTMLTADMAAFRFQADGPSHFWPGQYVMMDLPGLAGARAYSMCNTANAQGLWSFIIKRMPDGAGTTYLFDHLKPGDDIPFDGPYGLAYWRADSARDTVCIGGGSGLSPMLSILQAAATAPDAARRQIHFFYGGRTPADICTPDLLSALPLEGAQVHCCNAISDFENAPDWDGPVGFIHECVPARLPRPLAEYEFYFCGPPPMTRAVQSMLMIEHKVPFEQLHFDRFF